MKDSGVEWIGEIPEGWEVLKLKRVTTKITDGEHISPTFTDSGMPFLSAKDVREGFIEFPDNKFVSVRDGKKFRLRCNPEKEDVLLVSRGATIGRVSIVSSDKEFCLLGSVILLKPNSKIKSEYLLRSMENKLLQDNLLNTSHFSAQQAIYLVNVCEVKIAIPSLLEQTEIVKSVKSLETKIATTISLKEQEIEKLKEYKATLINSAVTGKIKVC
jgi:type I restriction enzyme S subunit